MGVIATLLIGGEDTGVLQTLLEILALAGGLEQQHQRVARDTSLIRFDLEGTIALRA